MKATREPESERRPDLSECDREPIHVPGRIQPFGVLLAKRTGSRRVSQVSMNTEALFGLAPFDVLGKSVAELFGEQTAEQVTRILANASWKDDNPVRGVVQRNGTAAPCNLIVHQYDGLDFVEVEEILPGSAPHGLQSHQVVQGALSRLQKASTISDLWNTVVMEIRRITGFDRVMVYRFDRDDHGTVIAEAKKDSLRPYLGLHYPASDIPAQARRLYRENWIRYIPDARYKPVGVIPVVDEDHSRLTDMTHCVLRAVSPVHCEYLQNMGVAASLSVSILRNERLWGLIACHHESPHSLPWEVRNACELLGQVISIRIAALEETEDNAYRSRTNAFQAKFLSELTQHSDLANALIARSTGLLGFISANGAAVCFGDRIYTVGATPDPDFIRLIVLNLLRRGTSPVFVTNCLQDRLIEGRDMTTTASGVLCFTASKVHDFHVLWFRTEQVHAVQWAGEPTKPVKVTEGDLRLSPRKSFEVWKQEVRGKSEAWTQPEIEAAAELRATIMSLLLAQ